MFVIVLCVFFGLLLLGAPIAFVLGLTGISHLALMSFDYFSMTKSNSLRVTPPPFISSPATIKKGMQVRLVILIPANIRWGITEK